MNDHHNIHRGVLVIMVICHEKPRIETNNDLIMFDPAIPEIEDLKNVVIFDFNFYICRSILLITIDKIEHIIYEIYYYNYK